MEVIVKKFEVSNAARCCFGDDKDKNWYKEAVDRMVSPEEIEREINNIISNRYGVSITVTPVETEKHNNGRGNTVELWYTIVVC